MSPLRQIEDAYLAALAHAARFGKALPSVPKPLGGPAADVTGWLARDPTRIRGLQNAAANLERRIRASEDSYAKACLDAARGARQLPPAPRLLADTVAASGGAEAWLRSRMPAAAE